MRHQSVFYWTARYQLELQLQLQYGLQYACRVLCFRCSRRNSRNVRRMHTAVRLNETIRRLSRDARLHILNLPGLPKSEIGEENCIRFVDQIAVEQNHHFTRC